MSYTDVQKKFTALEAAKQAKFDALESLPSIQFPYGPIVVSNETEFLAYETLFSGYLTREDERKNAETQGNLDIESAQNDLILSMSSGVWYQVEKDSEKIFIGLYQGSFQEIDGQTPIDQLPKN
jgi:hypothetical protein